MGLFNKKPKSIIVPRPADKAVPDSDAIDAIDAIDGHLPKLEEAPKPAPPAKAVKVGPPPKAPNPPKPPKPPKPAKRGKGGVDPVDFLALRSELVDMKARLEDSEQARAMVEARLSALDATAAAFSTERNDISEVASMVLQLQQQLGDRSSGNSGGAHATVGEGAHDELSAKVDALHNRIFGLQDHAPKIAEFELQIAQMRTELETATSAAAEAAALPPPPPAMTGPDPETLERIAAVQQRVNDLDQIRHRLGEIDHLKQRLGEIDHLHQRVAGVETLHERMGELGTVEQRLAMVDGLAAQLQQLNARVAAQAELGGQLSALRDRLAQITEQPRGADDDIRLQLQEVGERLRSSEALQAQVGELAQRAAANDTEARAVREHMAMLDQRLTNVSTELANQLSELGRDIDGLGQRVPEVADGGVTDEVVDTLRGGQVKLANEQARYEIAFRQDLATLAEQLRHGRADD